MNVLIVYAHPNPLSFNQSIQKVISTAFKNKGATVRLKDLYAEKFNPVLNEAQLSLQSEGKLPDDIRHEQEQVTWADTIVVIYPLWWFDRPAILKGWFDRVFTNGFAFSYGEEGVKGLLTGKRSMVVVTAGGTEDDFGKNADQLTKSTTEGTMAFCGITDIVDRVFYSVSIVEDDERKKMLEDIEEMVKNF